MVAILVPMPELSSFLFPLSRLCSALHGRATGATGAPVVLVAATGADRTAAFLNCWGSLEEGRDEGRDERSSNGGDERYAEGDTAQPGYVDILIPRYRPP